MNGSFKERLGRGERLIGIWSGLADAYCAEVCAGCGMDWILIDGEHGPNDLRAILAQLQALSGQPIEPVVRPPVDRPWILKQLLDIGARSLLIPMVETASQARDIVRATRYPRQGIRGVAGAVRAGRFGIDREYLHRANDRICLLLQVESRQGLDNLDEILRVEGVDGVFVGPADLAADLGHLGEPGHPEVRTTIDSAIRKIVAAGKAAGILVFDRDLAHHYLSLGAGFVAVGSDVGVLVQGVSGLAREFHGARREER